MRIFCLFVWFPEKLCMFSIYRVLSIAADRSTALDCLLDVIPILEEVSKPLFNLTSALCMSLFRNPMLFFQNWLDPDDVDKKNHLMMKVERSGSVGRVLDCGSKGCSFESLLAESLCLWARYFTRSPVLAQPRKTRSTMAEKLLTGM